MNIERRDKQGRALKKSRIDTVFVMLLFVLFAGCLLFVMMSFASVYKSIGGRIDARYEADTAASVIARKIQSYDRAGGFAVKNIDGLDVLCFYEEADGGEYVTYLYCYEDNLCELFVDIRYPFSAADGNIVTQASSLTVRQTAPECLEISVQTNDCITEFAAVLRSGIYSGGDGDEE